MKKIIVAGVSAGVGKSTFARKLGNELDLSVHHLDAFYWKSGWIERDKEEFKKIQRQLVEADQWIIEGNYASSMEIRLAQADTFIYLELPLRVCIYRVLKRWIDNQGKTRPDMAEGCSEKMDKEFLKFIMTTYASRKKAMRKRAADFEASGPDRKAIILQSKKQINNFLNDFHQIK
ncbi:P-loop NTPase family protein [Metaplanococcus flavidus]|uniref:Topology modulation protein n=1 Tax=Metaplanococcus flavidus TaxID=569883 RepID=A0ABW3LC89_9BACL